MDIMKMLGELRAEKGRLEEAILTLERLARGQGKRRGRPPKWMTASTNAVSKEPKASTGKRRKFSAETRAKMASSQKKRWAASRKETAATA